jgi:hypothetical protein
VAVTVNAASAKISPVTAGARPALFTDGKIVVCHLTKGFLGPNNLLPAFNATGEVGVTGTDAELRTFAFGFIQFQKIRSVTLTYSGGLVMPERIFLNASQAPALAQNPALDSRNAFTPFTSADPAILRGGKATNVMGDHPAAKALAALTHRNSGREDMLLSIRDSREFWTCFVARAPTGSIQYLTHFHWELVYDFTLDWQLTDFGNMRLKLAISNSSLKFDSPVAGPPTPPELAGLLASPRPPQANDLMDAAIKGAVLGGPPNRQDIDF